MGSGRMAMTRAFCVLGVAVLCGCSRLEMGLQYGEAVKIVSETIEPTNAAEETLTVYYDNGNVVSYPVDAAPTDYETRKTMTLYASTRPACEACGKTNDVETHHLYPQTPYPQLAADTNNMIQLCRGKSGGHHIWLGHGDGNTKHWNVNVRECARLMREGMRK